MKNLILLISILTLTTSIFAQKMAKDRYTISGGILGALNDSKFYIGGDNTDDIGYRRDIGWSAGAWLNLPVGSAFSVEPQVMYSLYKYESNSGNALLSSGNLSYVSVPLILKFHFTKGFAFTIGPQVDFLGSLEKTPASVVKDDFTSTSLSAFAGLEFLPHAPVVIFGRYIHGLTDMDNTGNENTDAEYYNSNFQLGLKLKLFGKMIPADTDEDGIPDVDDKCPLEYGLALYEGCPDRDGDGIIDSNDACPDTAGIEKYMGCPIPDTDKDGVNDEMDKCKDVPGVARYDGCPIPDLDRDGVNDEMDKCPNQPGVERYNGCPVPDTDGDGINDESDKCPDVAGSAMNNGCPNDRDKDGVIDNMDRCPDVPGPSDNAGCPKVVFSTTTVLFATGSSALSAKAKKDIKAAAKTLNGADLKSVKVEVQGHADSTGKPEFNQTLSEKRAKAVMNELIKQGVSADRVTSVGFGQNNPVADNSTAEGRTKNRRAEIKVKQ